MKFSQLAVVSGFVAMFSMSTAFGQAAGSPQSPTREEVRSEAIKSHKEGTMVHGEAAPKSKPFKSTKSRAEVKAEAIKSHKDGTMVHGEAAPKSEAFKSTKTRKEVKAEAIKSHKDGTMVHSEVTPVEPAKK
jgi:ribosomal protein S26